jgi:hypothetical protein
VIAENRDAKRQTKFLSPPNSALFSLLITNHQSPPLLTSHFSLLTSHLRLPPLGAQNLFIPRSRASIIRIEPNQSS